MLKKIVSIILLVIAILLITFLFTTLVEDLKQVDSTVLVAIISASAIIFTNILAKIIEHQNTKNADIRIKRKELYTELINSIIQIVKIGSNNFNTKNKEHSTIIDKLTKLNFAIVLYGSETMLKKYTKLYNIFGKDNFTIHEFKNAFGELLRGMRNDIGKDYYSTLFGQSTTNEDLLILVVKDEK